MINKIVSSVTAAVADIRDGSTVMIGGFGTAGMPSELIDALIAQGARDLTVVDMRDPRRPMLRLTEHAVKQLERLRETTAGEDA